MLSQKPPPLALELRNCFWSAWVPWLPSTKRPYPHHCPSRSTLLRHAVDRLQPAAEQAVIPFAATWCHRRCPNQRRHCSGQQVHEQGVPGLKVQGLCLRLPHAHAGARAHAGASSPLGLEQAALALQVDWPGSSTDLYSTSQSRRRCPNYRQRDCGTLLPTGHLAASLVPARPGQAAGLGPLAPLPPALEQLAQQVQMKLRGVLGQQALDLLASFAMLRWPQQMVSHPSW